MITLAEQTKFTVYHHKEFDFACRAQAIIIQISNQYRVRNARFELVIAEAPFFNYSARGGRAKVHVMNLKSENF
jgi:hypothetical protein